MCPALPYTSYEYAHLGPSSGKTERTKAMGFTTSSWDHSSSDCTRRFPFFRILGVCGFATATVATVAAADTLRLFESWCTRKHRKRKRSIFLIFAGHQETPFPLFEPKLGFLWSSVCTDSQFWVLSSLKPKQRGYQRGKKWVNSLLVLWYVKF